MCGAFCENSFWKINAFAHFLTFCAFVGVKIMRIFKMNKAKFVRGKQILRLQENKTLPFEEGKEEGREEDNNLVDIWYIKK